MKDSRWLLPFTCTLDTQAINTTLQLAKHQGATLVCVAFYAASPEASSHAEAFLHIVKTEAERCQVPIEQYQVSTKNVLQSITMLTYNLRCSSIVVVVGNKQGALLSLQEQRYLLLREQPVSLVLVRPAMYHEKTSILHPIENLLAWLGQSRKLVEHPQDVPAKIAQTVIETGQKN